ncbi:MAG: histidinol-phosphate transaminase [Candidatus Zixiibacteriota bacterium]
MAGVDQVLEADRLRSVKVKEKNESGAFPGRTTGSGKNMIRIASHIKNLKPYKAGKPIAEVLREKQLPRVVKLASNENPLGPSPKALAAIRENAENIHRYVDPRSARLVHAFASKHGIDPTRIIAGHGTDALLAYILEAFSEHGDELLTCHGTFIGVYVSTRKLGRELYTVPLSAYAFDLDSLAQAITDKTRIIYLANPNNPTGTMFTEKQFVAFMKHVPLNILVILDEAYTVYAADNPDYPNGLKFDYPNLIVTRSLSKAYGLGGIRIGFAVGPPDLIEVLFKVKLPFEPNFLAQEAAIAALGDRDFLSRTVDTNRKSLGMMVERFKQLCIVQIPTAANFILLLMPTELFAEAFMEECLSEGLIVRHVASFGIPNGIRINSGTIDETNFALDVIGRIYPAICDRMVTQPAPNN